MSIRGYGPVWGLNINGLGGLISPGQLMMGYDKNGIFTSLGPAGPVLWMSGQLLNELHAGCPDFVELDCGAWRDPPCPDAPVGDVIKIIGDDCKFVYVVRRRIHKDPLVYEVSWPD